MKRITVFCLALTLVLGFAPFAPAAEQAPAAAAPAPPPPPPPAVKPGDMVPAWSGLSLLDGKNLTSDSLKGKAYALVFVNSSCAACRGELSDLMKLDFGDRLKMIVVAMDVKTDRALAVYKDMLKVPFEIVHDADQKISEKFDFSYTPASAIVDKEGKIVGRIGGYGTNTKASVMEAFGKYAK